MTKSLQVPREKTKTAKKVISITERKLSRHGEEVPRRKRGKLQLQLYLKENLTRAMAPATGKKEKTLR